ncbi:hypothetical protein SCREM1_31 [Synechococcus phage S-CREM1]|nr:hypothetical protein SCREM1_31 [Synechococcus phage S-CREM1]
MKNQLKQPNKTTIYLDHRAIEQQTEEELQEQEAEELAQRGMRILGKSMMFFAVYPLIFMISFNVSLTKMFNFANIGYVESLGIVFMARILRGKND